MKINIGILTWRVFNLTRMNCLDYLTHLDAGTSGQGQHEQWQLVQYGQGQHQSEGSGLQQPVELDV
ncbi:unnamed protein product [Meloidogyne enterolobii]|uniref:Uncharacterized protein n=1 Tax=Meloidogyne enterolobii TaxID=390850 RepID=A0ACB0XQ78_MELEN